MPFKWGGGFLYWMESAFQTFKQKLPNIETFKNWLNTFDTPLYDDCGALDLKK
jgi:hypothetical protein